MRTNRETRDTGLGAVDHVEVGLEVGDRQRDSRENVGLGADFDIGGSVKRYDHADYQQVSDLNSATGQRVDDIH